MHALSTINSMNKMQFMEIFSGVYESSAWVAERALALRPFASAEELQRAFRAIVDRADPAEQDALIRAHPDLGGKLARAGGLTPESAREQSRLGLDQLDEATFQTFARLNQAYLDRFQFPFIICVGMLRHVSQIQEAFAARLENSPKQERQEALRQIHLIAGLRLGSLVEGFPPLLA